MKIKFEKKAQRFPFMKAEAVAIEKGITLRKRKRSKRKRKAWYKSQGLEIDYNA